MHDVRMYGEWNVDKENIASLSQSRSVDELREERGAHRIYSVDEAVDIVKGGGFLSLHAAVRGPSARARVEVPEDRHRRRDPRRQVALTHQRTCVNKRGIAPAADAGRMSSATTSPRRRAGG